MRIFTSEEKDSVPLVSIVVPCYNEQTTIRLLLDALYRQSFPRAEMEVIIADGLSTDQTRAQIEAFAGEHADLALRVVENTKRTIPAGLNCAIQAARGKYIVRLDGHSMPGADYVANCVAALEACKGDNVGGIWEIRPRGKGWQARSIAAAAAHPLGVGDARYRIGGNAQEVETVPFGAFSRSIVQRVGLFDESLLTNEDYEFNTRIRHSGGVVWFDPSIRSTYLAQASLPALARQYWRYGYWKARMLRRYPGSIRWRQALPPLFVLSLLVLGLLAFGFPPARWLLGIEIGLYLLALLFSGAQVAWKKQDLTYLPGIPLAIVTMHLAWGGAFLWSWLRR